MAKQRRKRGTAGDKTICLSIADDLDYATLVEDREAFRQYLNQQIAAHLELFPEGIESGDRFHGWVESSRQQIKTRRILLPKTGEAYQLRPDFVMPYMSETAERADKALFLRKHGLSFEGIAYGLGRSEMHWYRLCQSLGRASIVGSTVKTEAALPPI
jgi:dienelactone hydrolase